MDKIAPKSLHTSSACQFRKDQSTEGALYTTHNVYKTLKIRFASFFLNIFIFWSKFAKTATMIVAPSCDKNISGD